MFQVGGIQKKISGMGRDLEKHRGFGIRTLIGPCHADVYNAV